MPTPNDPLWKRIESFAFDAADEPPALPFVLRLARENRWTLRFAKRAVEEYRRFAYLAVTSDASATPSDEVDQVWHMHMTYTRSYWERFCEQVLGQPLHHEPTRGGSAEREKFQARYARTLQLYGEVFGERPPRDLWPSAPRRFAPSMQQRVDMNRCLVLPIWVAGWPGGVLRVVVTGAGLAAVFWHFLGDSIGVTPLPLGVAIVAFFACLATALLLSLPQQQNQDYRRRLRHDAVATGVVVAAGTKGEPEDDTGDDGGGGCGSGCGGCGGCG